MSKGWDSATLKKLKSLMGKGLSTSEIGRRLGMSKNAVVGKLNRLGWNAKAGAAKTSVKVATKKVATKAKPATKTPVKKTPIKIVAKKIATKGVAKKSNVTATGGKATSGKTADVKGTKKSAKSSAKNLAMHQRIIQHSLEMANLKPNQCRWPIGDPDSENFHFCGKPVFTGKPYCYEHCRLAYQFTPPKKKQ